MRKTKFTIAVRGIALVLSLMMLFSIVACSGGDDGKDGGVDYKNCAHEKYLTVAESLYMNQTVEADFSKTVTDEELDAEILSLLTYYGTPKYVTDRAAKDGDTVMIYYKGVTEKDGQETAFEGGTAMDFGNPYPLTLGSGQFISGFEEGLIGVIPNQTFIPSTDTSLTVAADSLIHISYEATYLQNNTTKSEKKENVLVNLASCDFGTEFVTAVVGMNVGDSKLFDAKYDITGDKQKDTVSMKVTVTDLIELQAHPVQATFPNPYPSSPDLAGKTVKFYVWVESIKEVVPAELTADFVTNTVKFETKEEDVVAAFKKDLLDEMQAMRDEEVENLKLSTAWERLLEGATVVQLPKKEVENYQKSFREQAEYYMQYYANYGYSFKDLADFVIQSEGITENTENFDVDAFFKKKAEDVVKEQLILWLLAERYELTVDAETMKEEVDKFLKEEVEYASSQGANYTEDQIREMYEEQYGKNYIENWVEQNLTFELVNEFLSKQYTVTFSNK